MNCRMNTQPSVIDSPLCSKTKHQHYYLKSLSHQNSNKWILPRLKNTEPKTRKNPLIGLFDQTFKLVLKAMPLENPRRLMNNPDG